VAIEITTGGFPITIRTGFLTQTGVTTTTTTEGLMAVIHLQLQYNVITVEEPII
jgi:hypothetical protein